MRAAHVGVKFFRKAFQVDFIGAQCPRQIALRLFINETVADQHDRHAAFAPRLRGVQHELGPDRRFVVGEGDRPGTGSFRARHQLGRRKILRRQIARRGLRKLPVLAMAAGHVAADAGQRKRVGARQHMIEGLFLDRIVVSGHRLAVHQAHQLAVVVAPHAAKTGLAGRDRTAVRTQVALNDIVLCLPETRSLHRSGR